METHNPEYLQEPGLRTTNPHLYSVDNLRFIYAVSLEFDSYRHERVLCVARHRILSITPTVILVAEGEYREPGGEAKAFRDRSGKPFSIALDRQILEQQGSLPWAGAIGTRFYLQENTWNYGDFVRKPRKIAPYLELLELDFPFSLPELKLAYRRQALQNHPDRGGSAPRFRLIQESYETLLRTLSEPEIAT